MEKILISNNKIVTRSGISKINPDISWSDLIKYQQAFCDSGYEYVLNVIPRNNRKVEYSRLAPGTFNTLKIGGKLIFNVINIKEFTISFISDYLGPTNENQAGLFQYSSTDFLFNKDMEINAHNLNVNIDVEHTQDGNQIIFFKRDLLPVENLTINCNQTRIFIQNQDLKRLVINNKESHCFNLILRNMFKLEYLDISNVQRLDLKEYKHKSLIVRNAPLFEKHYIYENINWNDWDGYGNQFEDLEACPINYFNLSAVNPDCVIKLNTNVCFYFQLPQILKNSDAMKAIPIFPNSDVINWYKIYLGHIVNCKNKKTIEIKWKTLQKKLLLKMLELAGNNNLDNKKQINKYFKELTNQKREEI